MIVSRWEIFKAALSIDVISIVALEGYHHMIRCLYAMFGYKHFLTTINYFRWLCTTFGGHILISTTIYYFWRPCTTFDGFWWLYTTFNGYTMLSTVKYYF